MEDVITLGRRIVPIEQIALVEPFDPASNPDFKPAKEFKARVVLLNRDIVLTELAPRDFAEGQGFRLLSEDNIAANPATEADLMIDRKSKRPRDPNRAARH